MGIPFQPIAGLGLTYHQQLGLYLAQTQDIEIENGVATFFAPDRHGRMTPVTVRPDPRDPARSICTLHKQVGFPWTPCGCHFGRYFRLNPLDPEKLEGLLRGCTDRDEPPTVGPVPERDFDATEWERLVPPYTADRKRYNSARKTALVDFLKISAYIETLIANSPRKQFGRDPYDLGRKIRMTLVREYFGFTYLGVEGFFEFLAQLKYIDDEFPKADCLSKFDRDPDTPQTLLALNAYLVQALRPLSKGACAVDGTGDGSNRYSDYRRDGKPQREKRLTLSRLQKGSDAAPRAEEVRRRQVFYHAHVLIDTDLNVMLGMAVTDAYGDEKAEARRLIAQVSDYWEIRRVTGDAGYNDALVRDCAAKVGAVPFIKWSSTAANAVNPARRSAVSNPGLIEKTFHLASADPQRWLAIHNRRWKVEGHIGAVKDKFGGSIRSHGLAGATTQIICKHVCDTIEKIAFAWRFLELDREFFGAPLNLGDE